MHIAIVNLRGDICNIAKLYSEGRGERNKFITRSGKINFSLPQDFHARARIIAKNDRIYLKNIPLRRIYREWQLCAAESFARYREGENGRGSQEGTARSREKTSPPTLPTDKDL